MLPQRVTPNVLPRITARLQVARFGFTPGRTYRTPAAVYSPRAGYFAIPNTHHARCQQPFWLTILLPLPIIVVPVLAAHTPFITDAVDPTDEQPPFYPPAVLVGRNLHVTGQPFVLKPRRRAPPVTLVGHWITCYGQALPLPTRWLPAHAHCRAARAHIYQVQCCQTPDSIQRT